MGGAALVAVQRKISAKPNRLNYQGSIPCLIFYIRRIVWIRLPIFKDSSGISQTGDAIHIFVQVPVAYLYPMSVFARFTALLASAA